MYILIADSGSTKTDWRLLSSAGQSQSFHTIGFSPYFQTTDFIAAEIKNNITTKLPDTILSEIKQVYYYGTGCSNEKQIKIVHDALQQNFVKANIEVQHDLLAAARALCGKQAGIAAILGTGSNSCYYDGNKITEQTASLGFILGDEGSGAHLGKTFIQAYLNNELPKDLSAHFHETYKLSKDEIIETVYKKAMPNRYLASFSKYIQANMDKPFIQSMVEKCFSSFFDMHVCKFTHAQVATFNCVGSVGFQYQTLIKKVAATKNIQVGKILESPIDGLVEYHTSTPR